MVLKGECACAAVKFTIQEEPKTFHACYCATCKAVSGGIMLSIEGGIDPSIDDPSGQLKFWQSSDWAERAFCQTCGSSIFYRLTIPGPMNGLHYFCPGGLKDWKDLKFSKEMYVDQRPPGMCFQVGKDHVALTKAQVDAQFASTS